MSKANSTIRTPSSVAKTPKRRKCTDPVEVSCRIRPLFGQGTKCVNKVDDTLLKITAPSTSQLYKNNPVAPFLYTFADVFDDDVSQKAVFDKLALPLVEDLIRGKNGLLFAYGVTNSGKTHTMIGQSNNPGILPRCLDVVFNSIGENQARPFIFLPDESNGMKIQAEYQAAVMKRTQEREKKQVERIKRQNIGRPQTPDMPDEIRIPDSTKLHCVNEDSAYAVFISYVEVYNNYIFDLLEEDTSNDFGHPILPESKKLGEDNKRRVMYVKEVKEIEVKSTEEACAQVWKGQERRRKAATILNERSSRSHSVFNIRLVQAPYDEEGKQILLNKESIAISQLSLVDLAGSERASKTNATGGALKEAGNINNSLMTLHTCLEILRANQLGKGNRLVPYRESKLTHLFKTYFEGTGKVKMIVCVNPRSEDFDETVHVMKFAELTQDVQVTRGQEVQFDDLAPGRRKNNILYQRVSASGLLDQNFGFNLPAVPPAFAMPPFPSWALADGSSEDKTQSVLAALHERQKIIKDAQSDFEKRKERMRAVLVAMEKENDELRAKTMAGTDEVSHLRAENEQLREEHLKMEREYLKIKRENDKLKKQNILCQSEMTNAIDERRRFETRIRREMEKRENDKKTFKAVVGREKAKWENKTEQLIRQVDLKAAHQESKLRQVLEIVGGNVDGLGKLTPLEMPILSEVEFPATSSEDGVDQMMARDPAGYTIPYHRRLDQLVLPGTDSSSESSSSSSGGPGNSPVPFGVKVLPDLPPRNVTPRSGGPKTPKTATPTSRQATPASRQPTPASKHPTPASRQPTPKITPRTVTPKPTPKGQKTASLWPAPEKAPRRGPASAAVPTPLECEIRVDDRPDQPLKVRVAQPMDGGSKWLNHRPVVNLEQVNILKPNLDNKKTVAIPEVEDFDGETNKYLLQHQDQDSSGELRTHFIKGNVFVSQGGGRSVHFTDIETMSQKPNAKGAFGVSLNAYPPPEADCGEWTDTETRCKVGVGIPTAKTKPAPIGR